MIDLKSLVGDRYRIALDESATMEPSRIERLWLARIPCRYGFISVHGHETLAAYTGRSKMATKIVAMNGVKVYQRGDKEARVLFTIDRLDAIADLLKAKRRVRLSPEERARRSEQMKSLINRRISDAPRDSRDQPRSPIDPDPQSIHAPV